MRLLDDFPFPFHKPAGQELWRTLADLMPVPLDAIALAEKHDVDPLDVPPELTPRQLWHLILETAAAKGTTGVWTARTCSRRTRGTGRRRS